MRKFAKVLFILLPLVILISQCTDEHDDTIEVMNSINEFYKAIEVGDVEERIELLADDVIIMPNHWTIVRGKEKVSESFRRAASAVFKLKDRVMLRLEVSDDIAYTVNSYYYTWHAKGDEPQWHKTKNIHIWQRNKEGQWQLTVDIWNSDVPMSKFNKE